MDRGEIDAQGSAASRLLALAAVHGKDCEAVEHLRKRAADLREVRRGAAFWAHMPRYGRPVADLFPELIAVLGDRKPSVPRGIAFPSEQLYRPHAGRVGGLAAGRADNRLHRCSRFPKIIQIRQEVYPATVQKMHSARKNLPFSTGYGKTRQGDTVLCARGRSNLRRNPLLCQLNFRNAGNAGTRPVAGRKRLPPFPQNISPIASGALPKPTGRSPRSSAGDPRAICTRTPCPRATVNRPNGLSSIVPTQQVDAHIRLAGIEGRRTPRAGGRRGCRRKRPGVQPGL